MPSLRDSGKIIGSAASLVSIKQLAHQCNLQFPLSLRQFIDAPGCPLSSCNRVHIKVLTNHTIPIDTMLNRMREVYNTAGIRVVVVSRENLTGPSVATLNNLDVGSCGSTPSAEQTQLFGNRNNVGNNEIVVYFVQTVTKTVGGNKILNGCASPSQGAAAIAQIASQWTLAHEVGHVLGLSHISGENAPACTTPNFTRLMTSCSTSSITGTPTVVQSEIDTMKGTNLTQRC
jgi:hypothetical protein